MYAFKKQCVFSAVHLERKCLSLHNNITQPFSKTACTQGQTKSRAKPLLSIIQFKHSFFVHVYISVKT